MQEGYPQLWPVPEEARERAPNITRQQFVIAEALGI
jgi:hypothetical protein